MSNYFKDRADRWRYMFGVGSFWSIFIPLIIVTALVANMIMTSKYQYTSDDLNESYWDGYNQASDDHDDDLEDAYSDGYADAESDSEAQNNRTYKEAFFDGYHYGYQDGSGDHTSSIVSEEEFVSSSAAYEKAQSARTTN